MRWLGWIYLKRNNNISLCGSKSANNEIVDKMGMEWFGFGLIPGALWE